MVHCHLSSGVPLGPSLFALYVNEFLSLVSSKLLMFTDDIKLYSTIRFPEDCLILHRDINVLLEWAPVINFNVAKCKVLHIGNAPYVGSYCLNETQLELLENILETLVYKLIQSLNFILTQILLLKKLTVFWALSVNLLNVKIPMLLLDYI